MTDRCPFCRADVRESLYTLKTFNCNTKHSLFSEEWVYWQSVECKDRQISDLQASRDRWKGLFEAYSEYGMGTYFTSDGEAEVKKAISALKEAGEWED